MSVVERIDTVFNNDDFLLSAADVNKKFDEDRLYYILAITLNYFLATRDTRTNFDVSGLEAEYGRINSRYLTTEEVEEIIMKGFLTHSFNAAERKYIEVYGFDYWNKISEKERIDLVSIRNMLNTLEDELGKNRYLMFRQSDNDKEIVNQEVYMTIPGTKTIHYAKNAPERFFFGPLGDYWYIDFPMVVGESKKDYLMRILKYRIEYCTYKADKEELLDLADKVIDYYIKYGSSIAFINFMDMIDKPVYAISYGMYEENCLKNYRDAMLQSRYKIEHIFTHQRNDRPEAYETGNLVTLAKYIPSNLSFASFPDIYSLKQQFLKDSGISEGVPVTYKNCIRLSSMNDYPKNIQKYYR